MASAGSGQTGANQHNFILSPHQQDLLFAALNSNAATLNTDAGRIKENGSAPMAFTESPVDAPGSGTHNSIEESPFIDYDYDFDADASFDNFDFSAISQGQDMIGNLPGGSGSSEGDLGETHDKRSHPDENDEDEDGGGKRREGDDKGARRPGRKPLTNEPTSKRKAQNRAAQRAFRERKEKHLKDLETKVQDLEKASESANHENAMLRAKVESMGRELREYRKKVSLGASANNSLSTMALPPYMTGKGLGNAVNNPNDVNFQFEFPQFGKLPGPPLLDASSTLIQTQQPATQHRDSSASSGGSVSPGDKASPTKSRSGAISNNLGMLNTTAPTFGQASQSSNDFSAYEGLFSPSVLASASKDFSFGASAVPNSEASRSSLDSSHRMNSTSNSTTYNSPSASSNSAGSNNGPSSSCGTSPEASGQSPANKAADNMKGVGEYKPTDTSNAGEQSFCEKLSMACGNPNQPVPRTMSESTPSGSSLYPTGVTPGFELNNFDWFAQQNGNLFDPQLFGDYREPQNNILAGNGLFDDSFFTEAIDMNQFSTPTTTEKSPVPAKKDLVSQIDDKLAAEEEVVPGEAAGQMLTCNNMWEKIQNCPSIQSGEVDMDALCTQLQQKAKCSGDGPVIDEKDFKSVIRSMFPADKPCPSAR